MHNSHLDPYGLASTTHTYLTPASALDKQPSTGHVGSAHMFSLSCLQGWLLSFESSSMAPSISGSFNHRGSLQSLDLVQLTHSSGHGWGPQRTCDHHPGLNYIPVAEGRGRG